MTPVSEIQDAPPNEEGQRLHPMTLLQRFVLSVPAFFLLLLPVLRSPDANTWFGLGAALLYALITIPLIVLQYLRFRYRITPQEIIIQSGVLTKRNRNIPIERIQNIEIEQSLLPRLFGTAKVKIETAGSTTTEGVLEYVALPEARSIRATVRAFQRAQQPASAMTAGAPTTLEDETDEATTPAAPSRPAALFAMPFSRVVLSGMFRFSLLYIVLIFSGMEYTGVNPEDIADWMVRGELERYTALAASMPWLVALATLLAVAMMAWVTGIAINVNRYYGFRLAREDDKLHKKSGLLTVSEGTIPLRKVQALIFRTTPLMRAFGWYTLQMQTMGLDVSERGHQVAVPFAREADVLRVARQIRPFTLPETFLPVSRLTIRRVFVRYAALLGLTVFAAAEFWQPAVWGLAALPLVFYYAVLHYRYHGYAVHEGALYIRRGVLRHRVWVIPVERFQVFYTYGSFFQRRLGLRSLYVDTAGAAALGAPVIIDLPEHEAEARLAELHEAFRMHFGT